MKSQKNLFKYLIGLITVLFFRLIPHPPNVEPIMSTMMPFGKRGGWISSALFAGLAMFLFDLVTGTLGPWSYLTVSTYIILGALAGLYLRNKENKIRYYVGFSIFGTLVYDAITGVLAGVLIWNQSLAVTVMGQIPFTIYHLGGNIVLSAIISPLLFKWVVKNPELETNTVIQRFIS